ncbi:MAG: type II toxin-antitoxin system VapC family toxin [Chitinophagaceae bacterium]|nr:type II toxin-antitoxin system VapC family toxin [Chitinophagaceae bacterium]
MNGVDFLADTNVLLYLLSGNPVVSDFLDSRLAISEITMLELLGVKDITAERLQIRQALVKNTRLVYLNDEIRSLTISLRQQCKVKLPDALIAATAQWLQVPLLTADRDFAKLPRLQLLLIQP